jgi:FkbM family methyltransferase
MIVRSEEVVQSAYNLLLNREPEPAGLKHWAHALDHGLSRVEFVRAVLASTEFRAQMASVEDLTKYRDIDLIIPVGGSQFRVPASDISLVPHLMAHRCWEPHVMRYLTQHLRPSHVFMDVGANLGYFTVLSAPLVERVIAFEPVARNHAYCGANIALNGLTNVDLRRCGLWREDRTLQITCDSSSVMTAAVAVDAADGSPALEPIRAVSLDSLVQSGGLKLPRLDVVKMDIEGAEMSALTGMRGTLSRFRPRIIMEVNRPMLDACDASVEEVWDFFKGLSYEVRAFEHWQERDPDPVANLEQLTRLCPPDSLIDIVAAPRGR